MIILAENNDKKSLIKHLQISLIAGNVFVFGMAI